MGGDDDERHRAPRAVADRFAVPVLPQQGVRRARAAHAADRRPPGAVGGAARGSAQRPARALRRPLCRLDDRVRAHASRVPAAARRAVEHAAGRAAQPAAQAAAGAAARPRTTAAARRRRAPRRGRAQPQQGPHEPLRALRRRRPPLDRRRVPRRRARLPRGARTAPRRRPPPGKERLSMWIVRLALRRPYTFVVMALLIVILGTLSVLGMPTDVFPNINIPVISVVYNYAGMPAEDMETRVLTQFERFVITTVNDIDHIDSQALTGVGVVKIFFQKTAKIEEAMSEVVATAQTGLRQMPPGTQPPLIIRYSASSVPILQLSISSDTLPEQQLFDITINQLRTQLITIPGVMIPYPYGGRQRQIMVDLDPDRLHAWGISAQEVSNAIGAQNLILPAGTAKIGEQEYPV